MVCGMIHRSEMQVLSVKFWRCSPISLFAQGARSLRFGCLSRTNERADRGRTHQRTIDTSVVQAAASAHRCGHALAFCALSAPRARVESPGRTRRRGITVRSRAHIAHKPHARRITNRRGSRRRNRLLNGFYRSPVMSLLAPPAPGPPKPCPG